MKKLFMLLFLFLASCSPYVSERCHPATEAQIGFINYMVAKNTKSNYVIDGYAVRSNDFEEVYMVATMLYGPSMEEGVGPAIFAVAGDPNDPGMWYSIDSFALAFTDFPEGSIFYEELNRNADGVEDVKTCYKK